jgi:hypothetical protein
MVTSKPNLAETWMNVGKMLICLASKSRFAIRDGHLE